MKQNNDVKTERKEKTIKKNKIYSHSSSYSTTSDKPYGRSSQKKNILKKI